MKQILDEMIKIAQEAGKYIKDNRAFKVMEKSGAANIVTTMDLEVQEMILKRLSEILPEAKVIAEENEFNNYDDSYVWVVDPIDATTNYAYDCKYSCISIALLNKLEGVAGVVYNPYLDETFYAIKGEGAYLNNKQLQVNSNDLSNSLIVVGSSPYKKSEADYTFDTLKQLFLHGRDIRRTGSAVLDICYVACGRFDAYFEANVAPWDYSASTVILKEANGIIEAIEPDVWGYGKSIGLIAGNKNNFSTLKSLTKR
ncbi:myo-inositol-1(or 4)-monophosphatase [Breznakia sp. PF5-3]|uniref:inositol monophosphatase family protein n=1 Tax=unclassified Breznakia TaxID=2623764 RepID=UPI0024060A07|nr:MULTISPECIES: inositol monophosphatase family protein [unclassified Breznakia]MDF9824835.1 myo-inositol-1(or 4)-monophosphatase [Breznakia sp. PM6-1]MDF9835203.1 myo-inositol-1(or 4)-monophosphatase [Breznakia sp. PF5-3]MDF9837315.1 myo-inositol-1(or 4)-monophosphatase [Breznakia sp. PFB2-8]MDF9859761.1 myo-inositol-1(or 4)-monophosphatase [Breznakia sp. PH5-24]